jgi:hypothetical protein
LEIENLDHLGLVAALVDEIGLVEITDELERQNYLPHGLSGLPVLSPKITPVNLRNVGSSSSGVSVGIATMLGFSV